MLQLNCYATVLGGTTAYKIFHKHKKQNGSSEPTTVRSGILCAAMYKYGDEHKAHSIRSYYPSMVYRRR
jgi:hypothetical protein